VFAGDANSPPLVTLSIPYSATTSANIVATPTLNAATGLTMVSNLSSLPAGSYTDHSGTARTGAVNLPYSTDANGNVVATVSPAGQINAIQKTGMQAVTVTFTTDDGPRVIAGRLDEFRQRLFVCWCCRWYYLPVATHVCANCGSQWRADAALYLSEQRG
jgi:hypothetical protein